jgi:hypothetical protein
MPKKEDEDDDDEALACDACTRARFGTIASLRAMHTLTPAHAARALQLGFSFYTNRWVLADECFADGPSLHWEEGHAHLVALAGALVHTVNAYTGESAPLGVAVRVVDLRSMPEYYRGRLSEAAWNAFVNALLRLLRHMCDLDEARFRRYMHAATLMRRSPFSAAPTLLGPDDEVVRVGRLHDVLHAVLLGPRLEFLLGHSPVDDLFVERDFSALHPTREDVLAAVCPHTGNTLLHWAALNLGALCWETRRALALACLAYVLMRRFGADPCAVNFAGQTPLQLARWSWRECMHRSLSPERTPLVETFRLAVADVHERRLALAMAMHPRLGAGSPLRALEPALLEAHLRDVGIGDRMARSPALSYAVRLRAFLRPLDDGRVAAATTDAVTGTVMDAAVLRRSVFTPTLRQRFRLAAQVDADASLLDEVMVVYRRLRRVRRRMGLPGANFRAGAVHNLYSGPTPAFFEAMRVVAARQVERGAMTRLLRRASAY